MKSNTYLKVVLTAINKFYKGFQLPRDITFIRGTLPKPDTFIFLKT